MFREKCYQMALFGNSKRERAARSVGHVSVCQDTASSAGLLFSHHAAKEKKKTLQDSFSVALGGHFYNTAKTTQLHQTGCTCILCGGEKIKKIKKN